jgi:hypothetical protein
MKKTAAPRSLAAVKTSNVGVITVDCALRSQARHPHGAFGGAAHGPSMTRPTSLASMAAQFDSAVSSMSNTTAGRSTIGASSLIHVIAGAVASCRSVRYAPLS